MSLKDKLLAKRAKAKAKAKAKSGGAAPAPKRGKAPVKPAPKRGKAPVKPAPKAGGKAPVKPAKAGGARGSFRRSHRKIVHKAPEWVRAGLRLYVVGGPQDPKYTKAMREYKRLIRAKNQKAGYTEDSSGRLRKYVSAETRKRGKANSGHNNPNWGKVMSKADRNKAVRAHKLAMKADPRKGRGKAGAHKRSLEKRGVKVPVHKVGKTQAKKVARKARK